MEKTVAAKRLGRLGCRGWQKYDTILKKRRASSILLWLHEYEVEETVQSGGGGGTVLTATTLRCVRAHPSTPVRANS